MSSIFIENYNKKLSFIHRFLFILFIIFTFVYRISGVSDNGFLMIYYILLSVVSLIFSEIMCYKQNTILNKYYTSICLVLITLMSLGCLITKVDLVLYIFIVVIQIELLFEFILFNSFFDEYTIVLKRFAGIIAFCVGIIGAFRDFINSEWFIFDILAFGIVAVVVYAITDYFIFWIKEYDNKVTNLFFDNMTLNEDKKDLMIYQERVKKVNSEINYQKINLAKANSDLEKINNEIRSQIEVMKFFSSTFDVPQSVNLLINKVMDTANAGLVTFYIDKNVYMNKYPFISTESKLSAAQKKTNKNIERIFKLIKERNSIEPLVIADNFNMIYDYFDDTNVCNAIAFPAYDNDSIYGVLVVASAKHDFFERGLTYYESSLMEFSVALRSTRLYLAMQDMARRDGLTGIYNRVYFNEVFALTCKKAEIEHKNLSVALFDIDKFKNINDTYGHLAGDEVIKLIANIDREFADKYNGMACRFGGEEFLLILPDTSCKEALSILEVLHEKVRTSKIHYEDKTINMNISIGLSSYPETCNSVNLLVNRADLAMYYGKKNGRGRLVVDSSSLEEIKIN